MSRVERGKKRATPELRESLARVLDVPVSILFANHLDPVDDAHDGES